MSTGNQNRTKWGLYHYAADFWSDAMDGETAAPDPVDPSDTCAVFDSEEEAMRGLERRHHAEYDYDYQVKALPIAEAAVPQPSDQDRKAGVCVDCGVWTCSHTDARLDAAEAEVEKLRAELATLGAAIVLPLARTEDTEITCISCGGPSSGIATEPCDYEFKVGTRSGIAWHGLHERCRDRATVFNSPAQRHRETEK